MKSKIEFGRAALGDLAALKRFEQKRILDEIEAKLSAEPLTLVRGHREPVQDPIPEGLAALVNDVFPGGLPWSLHVGDFRVLYAVEGRTVWIIAVRFKGRRAFPLLFP